MLPLLLLAAVTSLKPVKVKEPPARLYALPAGVEAAAAPVLVGAKVGKRRFWFADVDGNGRFDDAGTDGWCLKGGRYFVPVAPMIHVEDDAVRLTFGEKLTYEVEPMPARKVVRALLAELNRVRLRHGLPPVAYDDATATGCEMHARYMDRNGPSAQQSPGKPGYTEEGAAIAGRVASEVSGPPDSIVRTLFCSLDTRVNLYHPNARSAGAGAGNGFVCLAANVEPAPWQWPQPLPAPGSEDNPLRVRSPSTPYFDYATPEACRAAGLPITLTFPDTRISAAAAELRRKGPKGRVVPVQVAWPGHPAIASRRPNKRSIFVLPRAHLEPKTRYWVKIRYTWRGEEAERAWTFRTGRK